MNVCNLMSVFSVKGELVPDDLSCVSGISFSELNNLNPESLSDNYNIATAGIVKKGLCVDPSMISDLISAFRHESKKGEI